jgi:hypothetical protein
VLLLCAARTRGGLLGGLGGGSAAQSCQAGGEGVNDAPQLTTNQGIPISSYNDSETVGVRGPTLLEDAQLIEKMAQVGLQRCVAGKCCWKACKRGGIACC